MGGWKRGTCGACDVFASSSCQPSGPRLAGLTHSRGAAFRPLMRKRVKHPRSKLTLIVVAYTSPPLLVSFSRSGNRGHFVPFHEFNVKEASARVRVASCARLATIKKEKSICALSHT